LRYAPPLAAPSFSIEGPVALVTGATGGIGADLAAALGQAGARVGVAGRSGERVDAVVESVRAVAALPDNRCIVNCLGP
jgi:gluconate 5-dehydrogenase